MDILHLAAPCRNVPVTSTLERIVAKRDITVGSRVRLHGGYEMEPRWLAGQPGVEGLVAAFYPGQNDTPSALIHLDHPIDFEDVVGSRLLLELRHVGAKWKSGETVHIELCDFEPESKPWAQRKRGKWVESHATITVLSKRDAL